jgi:hypothetical protein
LHTLITRTCEYSITSALYCKAFFTLKIKDQPYTDDLITWTFTSKEVCLAGSREEGRKGCLVYLKHKKDLHSCLFEIGGDSRRWEHIPDGDSKEIGTWDPQPQVTRWYQHLSESKSRCTLENLDNSPPCSLSYKPRTLLNPPGLLTYITVN